MTEASAPPIGSVRLIGGTTPQACRAEVWTGESWAFIPGVTRAEWSVEVEGRPVLRLVLYAHAIEAMAEPEQVALSFITMPTPWQPRGGRSGED